MSISHHSKSVAHLMGKVLEDKLKLIRRDAALIIFTEHPEAFLKTKWTPQFRRKVTQRTCLTLYSFSRSTSVFFSTKIWQNSVKFINRVPLSILLIISLTSICDRHLTQHRRILTSFHPTPNLGWIMPNSSEGMDEVFG